MSSFLKAAKKCNPSMTLQSCSEEIPPAVLEEQQHHREQLNERKRDLQERERRDAESVEQRAKARGGHKPPIPVSYTPLTLPTKRIVENSVVKVYLKKKERGIKT
eukprot:TRINITY_DN40137_c0_g2_i1.p1 TRINITY_DN40137_c0_g2~~TRINITY_DN40137_c0_g2_i1.p1  ORF type:complete len:105 (-),score=8.77 TRINITY_DN40137_c0_g2_i1:49-363(-)